MGPIRRALPVLALIGWLLNGVAVFFLGGYDDPDGERVAAVGLVLVFVGMIVPWIVEVIRRRRAGGGNVRDEPDM